MSKRIIVKAISANGLGRGTDLVNAETGESLNLDGIRSITWGQDNGVGELCVRFCFFEVEATGVKPIGRKVDEDE